LFPAAIVIFERQFSIYDMRLTYINITILITILLVTGSCRKSDFYLEPSTISYQDYGQGTGTVTWSKDKTHLIEGLIFVNDGQTLTIEPGTVVRFRAGQGENASALVVARGGKIIARGTPAEPIIFTAESDDLNGSVAKDARGLWGGLIILGNAPVNLRGNEGYVEGIPLAEPRGYFGGYDPNDNSGVLKYVSIRHGGTNIGEGNEINGLTLAGVGRGTEIDYVEVISNADDGVEIFGGTVNLRRMVVSGCSDDAFDYDLGWSGYGQFWLAVQNNYVGDNLVEASGGLNPVDGLPNSVPVIFNATFIGNGNTGIGYCIKFDRNAGGIFANSLFINNKHGISVEVTDMIHDSYNQWQTGNLGLFNNLFYDVAASTPETMFELSGFSSESQRQQWSSHFAAGKNEISDPKINYVNGIFVPEEEVEGTMAVVPASWFQIVDFKGAFGESNWIEGWTLLSKQF
jgi:hypothetical protein